MPSDAQRPKVKLSVAMVTYNHERFLAQALDSALAQQTNFDFEIVVGEDCSTDGTRAIALDFKRHYPDKIQLLLQPKNRGMMPNALEMLAMCQGEYIAPLEGDDYWTDPLKLQKQVDYLDAHTDCASCFHPVLKVYDDGRPPERFPDFDLAPRYTITDILARWFIPTCSAVYRNRVFGPFPAWYASMPFGDWPLHVLNASKGDAGVIDEVMAAYRIHAGGIWSGGPKREESVLDYQRHYYPKTVLFLETIDRHFDGKYHDLIGPRLAEYTGDLVWAFRVARDWKNMRKYWVKASSYNGFAGRSPGLKWKTFLLAFAPPARWIKGGAREETPNNTGAGRGAASVR